MDVRCGIIGFLAFLLVIQKVPSCEANWLQDLMARFGGTGTFFGQGKAAHDTVYGNTDSNNGQPPSVAQQPRPTGQNQGSWTHELIAAAAGFEAMRTYERHQARQKGQPPNHSVVKGILAGLAAAAVDRLIETKGLDWIDAQRAKTSAARQAENMADQVEGGGGANFGGATNSQDGGSATGNRGGGRNRGNGGGQSQGNRDGNDAGTQTFSQQVAPATNDEY